MPSTAEIASGTEAATLSAPACTFSAAPLSRARTARRSRAVARPSREGPAGSPARHRPAAPGTAARARHHDRSAEHRHRRRQPARHPRLRHHQPHRALEHERQEDADEDDQERVADRPERSQHPCRGRDHQHGSHRQEQLDPARPVLRGLGVDAHRAIPDRSPGMRGDPPACSGTILHSASRKTPLLGARREVRPDIRMRRQRSRRACQAATPRPIGPPQRCRGCDVPEDDATGGMHGRAMRG